MVNRTTRRILKSLSEYYLLIITGVIVLALTIDISEVLINPIVGVGKYRESIFAVITVTCSLAFFLILRNRKEMPEGGQRHNLRLIHWILVIIQSILVATLVFVILEMLTGSYYHTFGPIAITIIGYALATILMLILAKWFFTLFAYNKSSIVLLYGLSSLSLSVNTIIVLALTIVLSQGLPSQVNSSSGATFFQLSMPRGSVIEMLNNARIISTAISFFVTWFATAVFLRHYGKRLGRVVYWIVISIPLAFFLSQFNSTFVALLLPLQASEPTTYFALFTVVYLLSKSLGGVLFGIAFLDIARHMPHGILKKYLIISACGFILFFVSNQAALTFIRAPYPPFGLASISGVALSSYLIMAGIYSCTISISNDVELRKLVRRLAVQESKFLDSAGTAQMGIDLEKRVLKIANEQAEKMKQDSGVQTSLTEEEVRQYFEEVVKTIKDRNA